MLRIDLLPESTWHLAWRYIRHLCSRPIVAPAAIFIVFLVMFAFAVTKARSKREKTIEMSLQIGHPIEVTLVVVDQSLRLVSAASPDIDTDLSKVETLDIRLNIAESDEVENPTITFHRDDGGFVAVLSGDPDEIRDPDFLRVVDR